MIVVFGFILSPGALPLETSDHSDSFGMCRWIEVCAEDCAHAAVQPTCVMMTCTFPACYVERSTLLLAGVARCTAQLPLGNIPKAG